MRNIRIKSFLSIALLIAMVMFVATDLFAQEREGFIKRMLRRFRREEVKEEVKEEKIEPKKEEEVLPEEAKIEAEERRALAEMTEMELTEMISERITLNPEVLSFIPQVKRQQDEEGNIFYTYTSKDGITKRLEKVDKPTLRRILGRVNGEINRLHNERLMRQLEQVREAQRAAAAGAPRTPRIVTPPAPPAAPPKIYLPPKPPTVITPPQITTPPTTPPRPPTTHKLPKR